MRQETAAGSVPAVMTPFRCNGSHSRKRRQHMRTQYAWAATSRHGLTALVLAAGIAVAGAVAPAAATATAAWPAPATLGTVSGTPTPALVTAGQPSGTAVVAWTGNGLVNASVRTPSA